MNSFLLAALALGLVAFLVADRRRRAKSGASPEPGRGRGRDGPRDGAADGDPRSAGAPEAESAASVTLAPALAPPPAAAPVDGPGGSPPAPALADWGFDEMILEPGWPMPGELAGGWPGDGPVAEVALAEVALAEAGTAATRSAEEATADGWSAADGWAAPAAEPYGAPVGAVAAEAHGDDPEMETWVPGVTEVEPVPLAGPEPLPGDGPAGEPVDAPAGAPRLVWADAVAAEPASPGAEVAGPPAWRPAAPEPADSEPAAVDPQAPDSPAWEPEPLGAGPAADDGAWPPEPAGDDLRLDADAVAEGLPRAVAALTPARAAGDHPGVTPRMAAVLRALADEPRAVADLGRALGLSRHVAADVCARLEGLELVRRERDPDGRRRRMIVVPTLRGLRRAHEPVAPLDRDAVAGALGRLSAAERTVLVAAVRALAGAR